MTGTLKKLRNLQSKITIYTKDGAKSMFLLRFSSFQVYLQLSFKTAKIVGERGGLEVDFKSEGTGFYPHTGHRVVSLSKTH